MEAKSAKGERTVLYSIARGFAWILFHFVFPVRYYGLENVCLDAPYLVVANHLSWLDPLIVAAPIKQYEVRFLGKKELCKNRFTKWFTRNMHMIPVDRHNSDLKALRDCMQVLKSGQVLGIFPEGTRHHKELMSEMESGVGLIALRSKAPLLPVYIHGKLKLFHETPVYIGKTMDLNDLYTEGSSNDVVEKLMKRIEETFKNMCKIAKKP